VNRSASTTRPTSGRAALVGLLLLASWASAAAETQTVEVTAEVYGLGRTPEQARHEALQRARDLAVAEVAGVHIAAQQLRLKSETTDSVRDAFSYLVHTATQGRIVNEEISFATRLDDDIPVYVATLRAEVVLEEGQRDPGFSVDLATQPNSHTYRRGEKLTLEITPSRDCYVTVLNLHADGQVSRLLPNRYATHHRVTAGEQLVLPGPGHGFEIRVDLRDGKRQDREHILVVATLDAVTFAMPSDAPDELVPASDSSLGLTALNQWLVRIPVERRTEALWNYEVVE
jgi:hypothetical protein